ncbi:hypothetical protein YK48G_18500 [Lentilactobacillus fungorum]|uniref:Uncharacterized protein n=1 Tax=Lentilactobacillus fungorum TaxID=2201250 RepID=A0ABQ3VZT7_9LACO|nr:hypothetical protein [Lentilactobacillus fungorum]GHP14425.1 hypothetical protein YK48G_18500 [Lentilactobacillus fungorum]
MKNKKMITILVVTLLIGSALCALIGVFSNDGNGRYTITSIDGQAVTLYGLGLYKHESLSMASQVIAQDYVILILGIPGLLFSLLYANKSLRGMFLLAGTLAFFLYTYMSYSFAANFNNLFLVYILLMTCSLVTFISVCIDITSYGLKNCFNAVTKLNFTAGFMIVMGTLVGLMWLAKIVPPLLSGTTPESLEHYTTLIIQAMDLGIVIPAMLVGGILTLKKNPLGYFLSVVLSVKALTLLVSITAMMIGMTANNVPPTIVEIIAFGTFNLIAFANIVFAIRGVRPNNVQLTSH